jgi:hypothetical protein
MTLYDLLEEEQSTVQDIVNNIDRYYLSYGIKKSHGKTRRIDAPQKQLAEIQQKILYKILYKYKPHPIAHGFVKHRSPKTNAAEHVGMKILITIDIRNFFNSIRFFQVEETLEYLFSKKRPYDEKDENDVLILAKLLTYRGRVPQGAATSPPLSNLFMLPFDKNLKKLATKYKLKITRYCDDIAISSNKANINVKNILEEIKRILREAGLIVHGQKTKVRRSYHRMKVTGIIVNEKTNVPREDWRNFRACLHNLKSKNFNSKKPNTGSPQKDSKMLNFTLEEQQQLRGYIEWVKHLNPIRGKQFLDQYEEILNTQKKLSTET